MKFLWFKNKKSEKADGDPAVKAGKTPPINLLRPLFLCVLLVLMAVVTFYYFKTNKEASALYDQLHQKVKPIIRSLISKIPMLPKFVPKGPAVTLRLKSGREFTGIMVKKNAEGHWLYIEGTGEVFFSSGEIAEEAV